jgi:hypothetical protein
MSVQGIRMKKSFSSVKKTLFLIISFVFVCLPASAQSSNKSQMEEAREGHAYAIGILALQYGSVLLRFENNWYKIAKDVNKLGHARMLATPNNRGGYSNRDTLYSISALDLRAGPLSLVVPDAGERYISVQIFDSFGEMVIISKGRSNGFGPGKYTLVGPGWVGSHPKDTTLLKLSGIRAKLLIRTLVYDENDLKNAHQVQDQFQLSASRPSEMKIQTKRSNRIAADIKNDPLSFYGELNRRLTEDPPPLSDSGLIVMLAQYGIGPNLKFDRESLDPASIRGLTRAI